MEQCLLPYTQSFGSIACGTGLHVLCNAVNVFCATIDAACCVVTISQCLDSLRKPYNITVGEEVAVVGHSTVSTTNQGIVKVMLELIELACRTCKCGSRLRLMCGVNAIASLATMK